MQRDVDCAIPAQASREARWAPFASDCGEDPWLGSRYARRKRCCVCETKYGQDRVNALCARALGARALGFEVLEVPKLGRMLKEARHIEDEGDKRGQVLPLLVRFAREVASFATWHREPATPDGERDRGGVGRRLSV